MLEESRRVQPLYRVAWASRGLTWRCRRSAARAVAAARPRAGRAPSGLRATRPQSPRATRTERAAAAAPPASRSRWPSYSPSLRPRRTSARSQSPPHCCGAVDRHGDIVAEASRERAARERRWRQKRLHFRCGRGALGLYLCLLFDSTRVCAVLHRDAAMRIGPSRGRLRLTRSRSPVARVEPTKEVAERAQIGDRELRREMARRGVARCRCWRRLPLEGRRAAWLISGLEQVEYCLRARRTGRVRARARTSAHCSRRTRKLVPSQLARHLQAPIGAAGSDRRRHSGGAATPECRNRCGRQQRASLAV